MTSGERRLAFGAHAEPINCLAFAPSSDLLITAGQDNHIDLYSALEPGERHHQGSLKRLAPVHRAARARLDGSPAGTYTLVRLDDFRFGTPTSFGLSV